MSTTLTDEPDEFERFMVVGDAVAKRLQSFVVPLFRLHASGIPEQFGSGFLVTHDGSTYLVSAAHVLDEVSRKAYRIGFPIGGRRYRHLHSNGLCTPLPPSGRREDDKLDVGVLRLLGEGLPPYTEIGKAAMPLDWLLPGFIMEPDHYLLIGFPASKSGLSRKLSLQYSSYWPVMVGAVSTDAFERLKLKPNVHIALKWRKRDFRGPGNKRVSRISAEGMSGSPVFVPLQDDDPSFERGFVVAGILTEWRYCDSALVATTSAIAHDMILKLSAEVSIARGDT